ncbi:MAG: hypothetical protein J6126_02560 [Clostridia bacterium]|nr:hypothetical protein [Clostridia bacterium]
MSRRAFKDRFYYDWVLYIAVAIVSAAGWYFIFGLFNAPAPTETLYVFFAGEVIDDSLAKEGTSALKERGVRLVEISSCRTDDDRFTTKYTVVGLSGCNVVVAPLSIAEKTDCADSFLEIEGFDDVYRQNGTAYGAFLSDSAKEALSGHFKFSEERYVVFVVESADGAAGETINENALAFLRWLISYGEN